MTRITLPVLAFSGFLALPLLDAATKGTLVLLMAGLACLLLKRDSAATRHCVLSVAVLVLLFMPLLSYSLPAWRVLPNWMAPVSNLSAVTSTENFDPNLEKNFSDARFDTSVVRKTNGDMPQNDARQSRIADQTSPLDIMVQPIKSKLESSSPALPSAASATPATPPIMNAWTLRLLQVLPLVWAVGVLGLWVRLARSVWQLRRSERDCSDGSELLRAELTRAMATIGLKRPVRLLLDPNDSIPIVWGLFRPRLRLPAAAIHWPKDQLQSVLLHELAHLRRRDLVELVATQLACALYWYNPLAWLASWRLHVERERACDDLVLASGVKPSAYAEHLLHVTTNLSTSPWTQVCGLAMARKSSLEGRLRAVLSRKLNRRGVTLALLSITMLFGAAFAIPVAMLGLANERPQAVEAQQEKIVEGPSVEPNDVEPQHEYSQTLFKKWKTRARTDGKIPGALIGQLAAKVDEYITQYPNDDATGKLIAVRDRFVADRDWKPAEVAAMLDEIAAIATAPISWTSLPLEFSDFQTIKTGQPLPPELTSIAWGAPVENGLRAAWLLEPNAEQYPLGSVLKVRVLFHNAGENPIIFRTETWHQSDRLTVHDAKGKELKTSGTWYTGITPLANYRILPGEYCEVSAPGLGIGAGEYLDERSTGNLGVIIEAKAGDEVSFFCTVDAAEGITFRRPDDPVGQGELWNKQVAERVASEAPLPQNAADREELIRRAMLDLTGVAPTTEEIELFVSDPSPEALENLIARIQAQNPIQPWTGKLPTGITKFRVTAADPNAAKRPRVATTPGRYVLSNSAHLMVQQVTAGDAPRKNSAKIAFLSANPREASPHEPFEIKLPDGLNNYAMIWVRDSGQLQIVEQGSIRTIDFSNPGYVTESTANENLSPEFRALLPEGLLKTLPAARETDDAQKPDAAADTHNATATGPPNGIAKPPRTLLFAADGTIRLDGKELSLKELKAEVAQDSSGRFVIQAPEDLVYARIAEVLVVLKSVGVTDVTMSKLTARVIISPESLLGTWRGERNGEDLRLSFHKPPAESKVQLDIYIGQATIGLLTEWRVAEDGLTVSVNRAGGGANALFGTLHLTDDGTLRLKLADNVESPSHRRDIILTRDQLEAATEPQQVEARELFNIWKTTANDDGTIPGTFIGRLATEVRAYVKANSHLDSAMKLPKLLPRFDTTRDWTLAEAKQLLDDIAYYSTKPLEASVEKAKLPSGPLWRTMVEFQDIPVPVDQWSESKDGLRIGLRVVEADWRVGGKAMVELWLHNDGTEERSFMTSSPNRQDTGLAVAAVAADGTERLADAGNIGILSLPLGCRLPSEHVAMVKKFDVTFALPDDQVTTGNSLRFREMEHGTYHLRCTWFAESPNTPSGWTGRLTAPDYAFTLVSEPETVDNKQ